MGIKVKLSSKEAEKIIMQAKINRKKYGRKTNKKNDHKK